VSLSSIIAAVERQAVPHSIPPKQLAAAMLALSEGWAWTGSKRHAVRTADLYLAVRKTGCPAAQVVATTKVAVQQLGGWFVLRGNRRHVRGARLNHMTDAEAWNASRALRPPWRIRKTLLK
jgi:hypothetical protein